MNDNANRLRLWESALLLALCAALCAGTWAQRVQNEISGSLIRLHVLAVSDDETEQAIKLRVRDAVLEYITPLLDSAESSAEAGRIIRSRLPEIRAAAQAAAGGREVSVTLSRESYPTREYNGFALPAGQYESLRVILGSGEGHNWWCVVFPPVCVSAAQAGELEGVLDSECCGIVTGEDGYELRFRLLEVWGELMNRLHELP